MTGAIVRPKKPISPWMVIRPLPRTKIAFIFSVTIIGAINLWNFTLYEYYKDLFSGWIRILTPLADFMSKYVYAINNFPFYIQKTWTPESIDLLRISLTLEWSLYIPIFILLFVCEISDIINDKKHFISIMQIQLEKSGRSLKFFIIGHAALSIISIWFLYFNTEFSQTFAFYSPDALFLLSLLCVFASISFPISSSLFIFFAILNKNPADVSKDVN